MSKCTGFFSSTKYIQQNFANNDAVFDDGNAKLLPSLDEVFQLKLPTLRYIPSNARPAFARVLSAALHSVVHENTVEAWTKLLLLPKCCLPSSKRKGRHSKLYDISALCDLWSRGQFGVLWRLAVSRSKTINFKGVHTESAQHKVESAISLARDGLCSKACQMLTSSGVAPNSAETWHLLESKHPKGQVPKLPMTSADPIKLPNDFDTMAILRSFPKSTAAGPSVQHLLDAATSLCRFQSLHPYTTL